jgi:glycosyltransferase involved in cell wall biosynthesis
VWNRAADVGRAIDSVCEQTLRDWELVVVDDGSTDDLAAVEARYADDPRISVVHRPHEGVGAARNAGLARARGRYVAWLDSDDTWTPEHLRVLIAFMQREGHRAAYDVLELRRPGHPPGYRTLAGGRDHLVNGNHIGQTVLVHERALVDEIGGYDETLPRTVDFDFILRMSAVTGFGFAPFVGCVVNHDPADVSRITRSHPATWIDVVLNRNTLDWAGAATTSRDAAGCTLVVLPYGGPAVVADSVRRLVASLDGTAARILLVDNGFDLATSQVVAAQAWRYDSVDVVAAPSDRGWAVALNLGALAARTETVVLVDPAVLPEPGWLPPLLTALDDDGVIGAQPGSGDADGDVTSLVWGVCALRVADLVAVRGLDPLMRPAFAMADLSARLRAERPGAFRAVPASVVRRPPAGLRPMSRHTELDAEAADAEGHALYEARWGPPSG